MVEIRLNYNDSWTSLPLSSLILFYKNRGIKFRLIIIDEPKLSTCLLIYDNSIGKSILIDCSDRPKEVLGFSTDYYFKRSLLSNLEYKNKIYPLGFTFPDYSQCDRVLSKLLFGKSYIKKLRKDRNVQIEAIRSIDFFGLLTNFNMQNRNRFKWESLKLQGNSNKVLYKTRLWNPDNVKNPIKKDQRIKMNEWRISMVDLLQNEFGRNSICGIQQDEFSRKMVRSEMLLPESSMKMSVYKKEMRVCGIGIADDGLEDTLGWKIGELVYFGKSLVSTEIKVKLPGEFIEKENFFSVSREFDEIIVGDSIEKLIANDKMRLEMSKRNLEYAKDYLFDSKMAEYIYSMI